MKPAIKPPNRRGVVAVEAAVVLPLLLIMMLGVWEVGRIIQVKQIMVNAGREGARLAAGGYTVDSAPVTQAMVRQAVRDYLRTAGLPEAAVTGSQVDLICTATPAWTDPYTANPLDPFQIRVRIPQGEAFESTRWSVLPRLTATNEMEAVVDWVSLNNVEISINTSLPY